MTLPPRFKNQEGVLEHAGWEKKQFPVIPGPSQRVRPEGAGPMTGSARNPESIITVGASPAPTVPMDSGLALRAPWNDDLSVTVGGIVQGRRGGRRAVGQEAVILGVPFRAGAAHIVQVRPVGAARFARSVPQLAENLREITPHETLPLALRWLFCPQLPPVDRARRNLMVNPYS